LKAFGAPAAVVQAHRAAERRFPDILPELCAELSLLRAPLPALFDGEKAPSSYALRRAETSLIADLPRSPVGRRMAIACLPFADLFVTPMAAVAGAVADELLAVMRAAATLDRVYVNDGGDIAVFCAAGQALEIAIAGDFTLGPLPARSGTISIRAGDGIGGIATSGARGRSFSLGIADSVTVLAADASTADAAATLIGNAVDCDHRAVLRRPAVELDPDSDLGEQLVTVSVGPLPRATRRAALVAGLLRARDYQARGLIADAALTLQGETVTLSQSSATLERIAS
jgi:hypothetical protein